MKSLLLVCFIFFGLQIKAQHQFPDLTYTKIEGGYTFAYPKSFKLEIKDATKVISSELTMMEDDTYLGSYKYKDGQTLRLFFSPGPSDDPIFYAYNTQNKEVFFVGASTLHFKGATVYTEGSVNQLFDKKRKFKYRRGEFKEQKQAAYYVGQKGKLERTVKLYRTQELKEVVATLPKGYDIELLVAEPAYGDDSETLFLAKSKLGLVGWIKVGVSDHFGGLMEDFRFWGD